MAKRYDNYELKRKPVKLDNGFLDCYGTLTKVGVLPYRQFDGSIRYELRHPDDVFDPASLETLKLAPVVLEHPFEHGGFVNSNNYAELSVGTVGENIEIVDGEFIDSKVRITKADAVEAVESRRKSELSCGYDCDVIEETGTYQGVHYTHRQKNITYNHVAITKKARAGKQVALHLDSEDAVLSDINKNKKDEVITMTLVKHKLSNGVEIETTEAGLQALQAEQKLRLDSEEKFTVLSIDISKMQAELDSAKAQIEELTKVNQDLQSVEHLDSALAARDELKEKARPFFAKDFDFKGKADNEIKKAVINARFPKADLSGKDDVYVAARFDSAIELGPINAEQSRIPIIDAARPVKQQHNDSADNNFGLDPNTHPAEIARLRRIEASKNAYKAGAK